MIKRSYASILSKTFFLNFLFSTSFIFAEGQKTEPTISDRPPLPHAMAVLGDSVSEGLLTDFSLEHPPTFHQFLEMFNISRKFHGENEMIAFRKAYAKPQHSWATGNDDSDLVNSHFKRLSAYRSDLRAYNFAVSGAVTNELLGQADLLLQTERRDNISIDYVVILIGANDLNKKKLEDITPPQKYAELLDQIVRKLLDNNPHREILYVGLPDIFTLFERSKKFKATRIFGKTYNCDQVRQNTYGPELAFKDTDAGSYNSVKMVKHEYDLAGHQVFDRLQLEYPAAYLKAISDYINPGKVVKLLSIDCFHPSIWGQAAIAEVTWQRGFWPDLGQ